MQGTASRVFVCFDPIVRRPFGPQRLDLMRLPMATMVREMESPPLAMLKVTAHMKLAMPSHVLQLCE